MERGFAVIGLGYVGLPVALALAKKFELVVGFDISQQRIAALRSANDSTGGKKRCSTRMGSRWSNWSLLAFASNDAAFTCKPLFSSLSLGERQGEGYRLSL